MIENGYTYMDGFGNELNNGDHVSFYEGEVGTVRFTDWDGDADDEGRPFVIPPRGVVTFACERCHGDKTIVVNTSRIRDPQEDRDLTCPVCHGTGVGEVTDWKDSATCRQEPYASMYADKIVFEDLRKVTP